MRNGGRRDRRLAADVAPGVPAAVAELDRRLGAAAVDRIDEPRQPRQEAVVIDAELAPAMASGPFRRRHLDRDQADAAAHARHVIGDGVVGDMALVVAEPRRHRRHDDAVLDLDAPMRAGVRRMDMRHHSSHVAEVAMSRIALQQSIAPDRAFAIMRP